MVETSGSQTRLQRLQRQRQRANQRHARASSASVASASTAAVPKNNSAVSNTAGVNASSGVAVKKVPPSQTAKSYGAGRKTPVASNRAINARSRPMMPNNNKGKGTMNPTAATQMDEDETSASSSA